ncbi:hypothetical protein [Actinomyces ruminicola]|uniref:Uncharacterized protein n=1 Tax=Actinomyces ruminicola TaxID=332524 RepID=A0A1G9WV65_9ACTO|nr:hypothetical protein [Actinomyces ruminicola]SDM88003.1 hypothetical protein SAMN04487766_10849 [Actinomyces ruminicola]
MHSRPNLTPDHDLHPADPQQTGLESSDSRPTSPRPSEFQSVDPQQARDLLRQADQLGVAAASGTGTPYAFFLLGLGSLCSMLTVAIYLGSFTDERLILLPLTVFLIWFAALITAMITTARAASLGFTRRWRVSIFSWVAVWAVTCFGGSVIWKGELWFTVLAVLALTAVTVWGALREAR